MRRLSSKTSLVALAVSLASSASAQTALPDITIGRPKKPVVKHVATPAPKPTPHRVAAVARPAPKPAPRRVPAPAPASVAPPPAPPSAEQKFDASQTAASEKFTTGAEVRAIPVQRPGEALEAAVPGLVVTQHSGEGKANQYQLRGFQLDHGTDLALTLDGMPLNMRTHAHGQGYADANFLMPELLQSIVSRKGPYYAEEGDFASAGAIHMQYVETLEKGLFSATGGMYGYGRLFAAKSDKFSGGDLLSAIELGNWEGPWVRPDEAHKINGVMRWSKGTQDDGASVTAMAYANRWYSTDQIPERAVTEGVIPLNGAIDPTDGGNTTRFSLSGRWSETDGGRTSRVEAYAIHSTLNLFNDFDYNLVQPILMDQFRQFDSRTILGLNAKQGYKYEVQGYPVETQLGLQGRYDDIRLGLQDTWQRQPYDTLSNDHVAEGSVGLWTDTTVKWTPWLRTTGGFRLDLYHASVGSIQDLQSAPWLAAGGLLTGAPSFLNNPIAGLPLYKIWTGPWDSGEKAAAITSPKATITLGPWNKTEFFLDFGEGFHSTDARGTVSTLNTVDGSQSATIPLLVKSRGAEIGARTKFVDGLDSTISLWWLNFDSENQFNGDTGTTQFGRPSRRYGIEWNNHYSPYGWLHLDADLALTHSRFRGVDQAQALTWATLVNPAAVGYFTFLGNAPGNYIPEGPPVVASVGMELGEETGWFGALKYRFKGAYPLTEDGYFKAPATGVVNLRAGYRWENGLKLSFDGFNVLNSRSDQITYAYGSLLPTDPLFAACQSAAAPAAVCAIGQMDRHFHPLEAAQFRATLSGPLSANALDPLFGPQTGAHTPYGDFMALASSLGEPPAVAGLPNKKAPAAPTPLWNGFYLGASAGALFGAHNDIDFATHPVASSFDPAMAVLQRGLFGESNAGFVGGGQAGFNRQFGARALVGFETDFAGVAGASGATASQNAVPSAAIPGNVLLGSVAASRKLDYLGSARGRLGYLLRPTALLYATGGLAYGHASLAANATALNAAPSGGVAALGFGAASTAQTRVGWTAGGGVEWMFAPNWSAKAEYLFYDLGGLDLALPQTSVATATGAISTNARTVLRAKVDGQIVRAGLNHHFDWGAAPAIGSQF